MTLQDTPKIKLDLTYDPAIPLPKDPGQDVTGTPSHLGVTATPFMTGKHRTSLGSQQHRLKSGNGTCIHEGVLFR